MTRLASRHDIPPAQHGPQPTTRAWHGIDSLPVPAKSQAIMAFSVELDGYVAF
jgi:hypothetical protein